jgi:magnesium transporter
VDEIKKIGPGLAGTSGRSGEAGSLSDLLGITRNSLASDDLDTLRLILNDQRAADLSELIRHLRAEERQHSFELLARPLAAVVLAKLGTLDMLSIVKYLSDQDLAGLIENMAPDDAADVLSDLPADQGTRALSLMSQKEAQEVRDLLAHGQDTGGGIMTSRLVSVPGEMSAGDALLDLRQGVEEAEIFYIYVVDEFERLCGTVPLGRLVLAPPDLPVSELADRDPVTVGIDMDQEEIARLFSRYDSMAMPVVDKDGRLAGQVTVDDIIDVIEDEATEDIYEMAGTSRGELKERSLFGVVRLRLPWLLVCLGGTLVSGVVIELFSDTLAQTMALALFIPAIMAMGGNTGIQTTTVTVRNLATGQVEASDIFRVVLRELRIALALGFTLSALTFGVAWFWLGQILVGVCVGLAMVSAIALSVCLGAAMPLIFWKLDIDPAVASGPLITTLNDVISLTIYFGLAVLLLEAWVPVAGM